MKKLSLTEIIEKTKMVHGNKYDYSKVEYKNYETKVCIICPEHGEFWQNMHDHLSGHGCPICKARKSSKLLSSNIKEFVKKATKIHGYKYDYSKVEYNGDNKKVCIICPEHGEFWQTPNSHLSGHGCLKCGFKKLSNAKTKPYCDFLNEALKKHNNKYTYDETTYVNRSTKMKIICPEHGEFWQEPRHHIAGHGCPSCNDSILEKEVESLLIENRIKYVKKCTSNILKWLEKQHLDFFLPDYNVAIECQGIQHYEPREKFGGKEEFIKNVERDSKKKQKCLNNNVFLMYYSSNYIKRKFDNKVITKNNLIKSIKNAEVQNRNK